MAREIRQRSFGVELEKKETTVQTRAADVQDKRGLLAWLQSKAETMLQQADTGGLPPLHDAEQDEGQPEQDEGGATARVGKKQRRGRGGAKSKGGASAA